MAGEEITTTVEAGESAAGSEGFEAAHEAAEAEAQAEQAVQEREEASKIDAFLRARGIPGYGGDDDDGDADEDVAAADQGDDGETDEGDEEAPTEEQLMGRELSIITAALDEIDGGRPAEPQLSDAERGFMKRQESREIRRFQEENQQLKSYVNALLSVVQSGQQLPAGEPPPGPSPAGQEGTEGPDLFEDPKGYLDRYFKTQVQPLQEKLERFEAMERSHRVRQHVGRLEQKWEQEHPGYIDRLAAYRRAFVAELQYFGKNLQEAEIALVENERQLLDVAIQNNVNPAELLDRSAQRWIAGSGNGTAAPAAQQVPNGKPPRRSQFERAREAVTSAAADTLSQGSGGVDGNEITAETLLASGASPEQVHRVLSAPEGRNRFFKLMREVEAGGRE